MCSHIPNPIWPCCYPWRALVQRAGGRGGKSKVTQHLGLRSCPSPAQIPDQTDVPRQAGHVISTGDHRRWLALSSCHFRSGCWEESLGVQVFPAEKRHPHPPGVRCCVCRIGARGGGTGGVVRAWPTWIRTAAESPAGCVIWGKTRDCSELQFLIRKMGVMTPMLLGEI